MKRQEAPKQMPLRKSLAALALALCTLGATGCDNWSFDFKTPGALEESGDKKYQVGDYEGAIDDYRIIDCLLDQQQIQELYLYNVFNPQVFSWSNQATSSSTFVNPSSTSMYYATITNSLGSCIDSTLVTVNAPNVDLGPDTTFCSGTNYTLDAGSGFTSYLWSDGSTNSTLNVNGTGTYWVEVTNTAGCTNSDTVIIYQGVLNIDAGPTQTVCLGCADIPDDSATLRFAKRVEASVNF